MMAFGGFFNTLNYTFSNNITSEYPLKKTQRGVSVSCSLKEPLLTQGPPDSALVWGGLRGSGRSEALRLCRCPADETIVSLQWMFAAMFTAHTAEGGSGHLALKR